MDEEPVGLYVIPPRWEVLHGASVFIFAAVLLAGYLINHIGDEAITARIEARATAAENELNALKAPRYPLTNEQRDRLAKVLDAVPINERFEVIRKRSEILHRLRCSRAPGAQRQASARADHQKSSHEIGLHAAPSHFGWHGGFQTSLQLLSGDCMQCAANTRLPGVRVAPHKAKQTNLALAKSC